MSNARITSRTTQIAVRLPNAEMDRLSAICAAMKMSVAEAVRAAIAAWPLPVSSEIARGVLSAERARLMLREPERVARYAEMTDISPAEAWKRVREAAGVAL